MASKKMSDLKTKVLNDLKVVASICAGDTVSTTRMIVLNHNSWMSSIWRKYSGENRKNTVQFVRMIFLESVSILDENTDIIPKINDAILGFLNLKITYTDDKEICKEIDDIIASVKQSIETAEQNTVAPILEPSKCIDISGTFRPSDEGIICNVQHSPRVSEQLPETEVHGKLNEPVKHVEFTIGERDSDNGEDIPTFPEDVEPSHSFRGESGTSSGTSSGTTLGANKFICTEKNNERKKPSRRDSPIVREMVTIPDGTKHKKSYKDAVASNSANGNTARTSSRNSSTSVPVEKKEETLITEDIDDIRDFFMKFLKSAL